MTVMDVRGRTMAAVAAALALSFAGAIVPFGASSQVRAADPATTVIAKYRTLIPELMAEQRISQLGMAGA